MATVVEGQLSAGYAAPLMRLDAALLPLRLWSAPATTESVGVAA